MLRQWLASLRAAFGNLSPRERTLVGVVGGLTFVTVVWLGIVQPLQDIGEHSEQRVAAAEQQLEVMKRLRGQYDEVSHRLNAIEERIQEGPRGNLRTTLESLAGKAGVKIESMEPQASPANERYRETKVEVGLKRVSLPQTVRYLHEIEASGQAFSLKTLRIRTRTDQTGLLDVTFTVSSFEPI